jgi:excinuclease ABC subunit B
MYADTITESMKLTIDETNRRRKIQHEYNVKNNITPQPLKPKDQFALSKETEIPVAVASEPQSQFNASKKKLSEKDIPTIIEELKKEMATAAKAMDFITAAQLRDEIKRLESIKANS